MKRSGMLVLGPALALLLAGCANSPVSKDGIMVRGHGEVKAVPNVAELYLTIVTTNKDNIASEAVAANAARSESVRKALTAMGIGKKDISTESFNAQSVQPYVYQPHYRPAGKPYFKVRNSLQVTTKDIEAIGKIIDAAIKAGATSVDSLNYRFGDTSKLEAEALARAVTDARTRADGVAKAGDVHIVSLTSVRSYGIGEPQYAGMATDGGGRVYQANPIFINTYASPKEETVEGNVVATFAIRH